MMVQLLMGPLDGSLVDVREPCPMRIHMAKLPDNTGSLKMWEMSNPKPAEFRIRDAVYERTLYNTKEGMTTYVYIRDKKR